MVIYLALIKSDNAWSPPRLIIREDRQELKDYLYTLPIKAMPACVLTIAEYNFKSKVTKYYTVEKFLAS